MFQLGLERVGREDKRKSLVEVRYFDQLVDRLRVGSCRVGPVDRLRVEEESRREGSLR